MPQPLCLDCRFFATLDDETRAADLSIADRDNCLQGLCRRNPPTVGRFRGEEESLEYDYGQWPLVMSGDWCGAFEPCRRALCDSAPRRARLARVATSLAGPGKDAATPMGADVARNVKRGKPAKARFLPRKRRR